MFDSLWKLQYNGNIIFANIKDILVLSDILQLTHNTQMVHTLFKIAIRKKAIYERYFQKNFSFVVCSNH